MSMLIMSPHVLNPSISNLGQPPTSTYDSSKQDTKSTQTQASHESFMKLNSENKSSTQKVQGLNFIA